MSVPSARLTSFETSSLPWHARYYDALGRRGVSTAGIFYRVYDVEGLRLTEYFAGGIWGDGATQLWTEYWWDEWSPIGLPSGGLECKPARI